MGSHNNRSRSDVRLLRLGILTAIAGLGMCYLEFADSHASGYASAAARITAAIPCLSVLVAAAFIIVAAVQRETDRRQLLKRAARFGIGWIVVSGAVAAGAHACVRAYSIAVSIALIACSLALSVGIAARQHFEDDACCDQTKDGWSSRRSISATATIWIWCGWLGGYLALLLSYPPSLYGACVAVHPVASLGGAAFALGVMAAGIRAIRCTTVVMKEQKPIAANEARTAMLSGVLAGVAVAVFVLSILRGPESDVAVEQARRQFGEQFGYGPLRVSYTQSGNGPIRIIADVLRSGHGVCDVVRVDMETTGTVE